MITDRSKKDSLHSDRTAGDRLRHRQKVKEAIRQNIPDIIAEESIIGKDKNRIVKVPIRGIKEYRFIYGENTPGVGSGGEDLQPGQAIGKGKGPGQDQQAGDRPGVDYYETDISIEEVIELAFEDLQLPYMDRKKFKEIEVETSSKRKGLSKRGIPVRIRKDKTVKKHKKTEQMRRHGVSQVRKEIETLRKAGKNDEADVLEKKLNESIDEQKRIWEKMGVTPREGKVPLQKDDIIYARLTTDIIKESNAVVICIMDTSGSMDTMKKYLARSFFYLLSKFVATKYKNTEVVFVAHHTEAAEVSEKDFFHKGESGGTFISSGYKKALEIIDERYSPEIWNIYVFHCSDGDNFESDNDATIETAKMLANISNLFGYGEIKPLGSGYYGNSMIRFFNSNISSDNFQTVEIKRKEDVWSSFQEFTKKDRAKEVK